MISSYISYIILSIEGDSITTYSNEEELVTLSPKKGDSLRLKSDEEDDEKPPIIFDDGTEIDDIIKGNLNPVSYTHLTLPTICSV